MFVYLSNTITRISTTCHRYFRESFFWSSYGLPARTHQSEAQGGRNGLRIAGLIGIRIGGNVITLPETGSPEVFSATSSIVLSVKGSKKSIRPVRGASEPFSKAAYEIMLIYTTTSKTNAPKNILALRLNLFLLYIIASEARGTDKTHLQYGPISSRSLCFLAPREMPKEFGERLMKRLQSSLFHKTLITCPLFENRQSFLRLRS